jgi:hypothetical protein
MIMEKIALFSSGEKFPSIQENIARDLSKCN